MKKKTFRQRLWYFIWEDDSIWSWLVNIGLAFILIKFLVYPGIGWLLGTSFPIVAVVSESMQHTPDQGLLCGRQMNDFKYSFNQYWSICGSWYEERGISPEQFLTFPLEDGFNKGDVIILMGARPGNLHIGDIVVYQGPKPQPIIHRLVKITEENGQPIYQTKGDHNSDSIHSESLNEEQIRHEILVGKGVIRIPYLGWIKILFVEAVRPFGWVIER